MPSNEKILRMILCGTKDKSIKFRDLQKLLGSMGFDCRTKGDHFIYTYKNLPEIINIQPDNGMAKPYQIKQIRNFIVKYRLTLS